MLEWMRSVEKIPSIPAIKTGLVDLCVFLTKQLGKKAVMYELGSFAGESAEVFAAYFKTVHCVDPWQDPCGAPSLAEVEASFDERAAEAGNMIKHKTGSLEAAENVPDSSLDFVYVDAGTHSYQEALRDISAWWPKVRSGGFLGGHDHENPDTPSAQPHFTGVGDALRHFLGQHPEEYGLKLFLDTSFVVRKP